MYLSESRQSGTVRPITRDMADELWNKLQHALLSEGLNYKDLPKTEVLLYGTLEELGFTRFLDRVKLKKQLVERVRKETSQQVADPFKPCTHHQESATYSHEPVTDSPMALVPVEFAPTSEDRRLSEPGSRGLAAACRSAFEMVTDACNEATNVSLWIRMPKEMQTIDEARYAYDLLKEIRNKHLDCTIKALEASPALQS